MKAGRYFFSLDGIRGVAALLVAMRHLEAFFGRVSFLESYLAVDLFFVLSGVVLANAYEERLKDGLSARHFMWIRLARLYPLYILGSAITVVAIALGLNAGIKANQLALLILLSAFMIPNLAPSLSVSLYPLNAPAWSLFFELVANLLYAKWVRVLTSHRLILLMILSASCLAATLVFSKYHNLSIGFTINGTPVALVRVMYSFFAGIWIYRRFASRRDGVFLVGHRASIAVYAILSSIGLVLMVSPPVNLRPYFDFLAVTAVFPTVTYLALWIQPNGRTARICQFLGVISYAVYALHAPLGLLTQGLLDAKSVDYGRYTPAVGFAFLAMLVPMCWKIDSKYDLPLRRALLSKAKYVVGLPPAYAAK
jgi:peptidoglycan/LPS O-acetylase OafA/YrhL